MIKNIEIKNFRCFRNLSVSLAPLTVLIGANDTGKSTFLEAIRLVLRRSGGDLEPEDAFRHANIDETSIYVITSQSDGRIDSAEHRPPLEVRRVGFFRLPTTGILMESSAIPDQAGNSKFGEDGSNVPGFIDYILRRDRDRFFRLTKSLRSLISGFNDLIIGTPSLETRRIDLIVEDGFIIPAESASSGVRMLIFFAALALHPDPPDLILIEEPENGIHPKRLGEVMRLLRSITKGEHGLHPAQVILTTHSPYLLDSVDMDTDQVLVFRREEDGSRIAEPADRERLATFLDEFQLGEVWFNQGEEGLVSRKS